MQLSCSSCTRKHTCVTWGSPLLQLPLVVEVVVVLAVAEKVVRVVHQVALGMDQEVALVGLVVVEEVEAVEVAAVLRVVAVAVALALEVEVVVVVVVVVVVITAACLGKLGKAINQALPNSYYVIKSPCGTRVCNLAVYV
ncbi:Uncharacterized protein TCM_020409 [Theobroma cacao]|uniref:Uncharacterized protein n=1 Tax=Theobroma cacao TaxID=3641 RepID=A0A061EK27_THECC|nr:Uncharacterized protein TCM_020409 [Theobroma cacao]